MKLEHCGQYTYMSQMPHFRFSPLIGCALILLLSTCGTVPCSARTCTTGGLVINEMAANNNDFVEQFNASDASVDISGFGLADLEADGGVRFAGSVRFASGTSVPPRGYFTVFLEANCPTEVSPCTRGEFGLSQDNGDTVSLLDAQNNIVQQTVLPPAAAPSSSSWARSFDGAPNFAAQRRSPGSANAP